MITYYLHELKWNQIQVKLPELKQPIGTHHLVTISETIDEFQQEGARSVLLAYNRTKQPICRVIVDKSAEPDFQSLQNVLLTSKLR